MLVTCMYLFYRNDKLNFKSLKQFFCDDYCAYTQTYINKHFYKITVLFMSFITEAFYNHLAFYSPKVAIIVCGIKLYLLLIIFLLVL